MYTLNNNAKEYILRDIATQIKDNKNISILDFACGTCSIWDTFLKMNKNLDFNAFDFKLNSINIAKKKYPQFRDKILNLDGQKRLPYKNKFDIITTFSSIEHVVNKAAFIKNIKELLGTNGIAYINYDLGHFHDSSREDICNFTSQILAHLKITEKYYTKNVSMDQIKTILKDLNLEILDLKFFNIIKLKKLHKKLNSIEHVQSWYDYELHLNTHKNKEVLENVLTSVVIKVKKNA